MKKFNLDKEKITLKLRSIFGSNLLFACIVGSVAQNNIRASSDVDFFICVKRKDSNQIKNFINYYYNIHKLHGLKPDIKYPGEITTMNTLRKSLNGIQKVRPRRCIENVGTYDGIVWSGMLSSRKLVLFNKLNNIDELVLLAKNNIKKWNKILFGIDKNYCDSNFKNSIFFKDLDYILNQSNKLVRNLNKNKKKLEEILLCIENYDTFKYEFNMAIDTLKNIEKEIKNIQMGHVNYISTFIPVNLPLFSLIIYGFIPSMMCERNFIKLPQKTHKQIKQIEKILFKDCFQMHFFVGEKNTFSKNYVANSDVIIFTGSYENSIYLSKKHTDKLTIFNGFGVNPIIVSDDADIDLSVKSVVDCRFFNSGQDCAGPDCVIVNDKIFEEFNSKLRAEVTNLNIGQYVDKKNNIGPLVKPLEEIISGKFFKEYKKYITYGSKIDRRKRIVYPTIVELPLGKEHNYKEFFAPILWLSKYKNLKELKGYFYNSDYTDFAMYTSVFGSCKIKIPKTITLKNKTILELDQGNQAFGGYGDKVSFVSYENKIYNRPILISKEILNYIKKTNYSLN